MSTFDFGKFQRLRRQRAERQVALRDASETYRHWRGEVQRLEGVLRSFAQRDSRPWPEQERETEYARARLAEAKAHVESLQAEATPFAELVTRLETYLRDQQIDPDRITAIATPARQAPGVFRIEDVDAIRARIGEACEERTQVRRAPITEREAHARIDAWLDAAAARLAIAGHAFVRADRADAFALLSRLDGAIERAEDKRLVEALFASTNPAVLRKLLRTAAEDAAQAAGGWGLSTRERETRLRELDAEIYQLERAEEHAIEALAAMGLVVARRADVDPRAVLALGDVVNEPAPALSA